jgi:hypothetical protein
MPSKAAMCVTAAIAGALVAAVVAAGPAHAVPTPEIPADVAATFAGAAVRQLRADPGTLDTDFSGDIRADDIHEVFAFTREFVRGTPTREPVASTGSWIASITRGEEEVLGTVWVWKPDGGRAEVQGYADYVELGVALADVGPTDILIEDAPTGAWFALSGDTLRPLNNWARQALPEPGNISGLQETIADQYALIRGQATDYPDIPSVAISLAGMAGAIVVGGLLLVLGRRRRRVQAP